MGGIDEEEIIDEAEEDDTEIKENSTFDSAANVDIDNMDKTIEINDETYKPSKSSVSWADNDDNNVIKTAEDRITQDKARAARPLPQPPTVTPSTANALPARAKSAAMTSLLASIAARSDGGGDDSNSSNIKKEKSNWEDGSDNNEEVENINNSKDKKKINVILPSTTEKKASSNTKETVKAVIAPKSPSLDLAPPPPPPPMQEQDNDEDDDDLFSTNKEDPFGLFGSKVCKQQRQWKFFV